MSGVASGSQAQHRLFNQNRSNRGHHCTVQRAHGALLEPWCQQTAQLQARCGDPAGAWTQPAGSCHCILACECACACFNSSTCLHASRMEQMLKLLLQLTTCILDMHGQFRIGWNCGMHIAQSMVVARTSRCSFCAWCSYMCVHVQVCSSSWRSCNSALRSKCGWLWFWDLDQVDVTGGHISA